MSKRKKVIVENLVAEMNGGDPIYLQDNQTIRFEIGNTKLSCSATDEGIRIYKVNNIGNEESRIQLTSQSSNVVYIS